MHEEYEVKYRNARHKYGVDALFKGLVVVCLTEILNIAIIAGVYLMRPW